MGRVEANAVRKRDFAETPPPPGVHPHEHYREADKAYAASARSERSGVNIYRDLSGGDPDRPGRAKAFNMGIVWHGHLPEEHEAGTNYEDEHNLPFGSHVTVTGARLFIPKSGTVHSLRERHPTTFTHEERADAHMDVLQRSTYSHIGETSPAPWSRVQFQSPIHLPVGQKKWGLR
jgi:hypothetical protein